MLLTREFILLDGSRVGGDLTLSAINSFTALLVRSHGNGPPVVGTGHIGLSVGCRTLSNMPAIVLKPNKAAE